MENDVYKENIWDGIELLLHQECMKNQKKLIKRSVI